MLFSLDETLIMAGETFGNGAVHLHLHFFAKEMAKKRTDLKLN